MKSKTSTLKLVKLTSIEDKDVDITELPKMLVKLLNVVMILPVNIVSKLNK